MTGRGAAAALAACCRRGCEGCCRGPGARRWAVSCIGDAGQWGRSPGAGSLGGGGPAAGPGERAEPARAGLRPFRCGLVRVPAGTGLCGLRSAEGDGPCAPWQRWQGQGGCLGRAAEPWGWGFRSTALAPPVTPGSARARPLLPPHSSCVPSAFLPAGSRLGKAGPNPSVFCSTPGSQASRQSPFWFQHNCLLIIFAYPLYECYQTVRQLPSQPASSGSGSR